MKFVFINLLLTVSVNILAQSRLSHDDSLLIGTWKGTSICQVRPSPCNDEISVCHITKANKPSTYHIVMNKVINEKEEDMAVNDYSFDAPSKTLSCWEDKYKITITLHVIDNRMEGTLVYQNKVYRIIKLSKADNK